MQTIRYKLGFDVAHEAVGEMIVQPYCSNMLPQWSLLDKTGWQLALTTTFAGHTLESANPVETHYVLSRVPVGGPWDTVDVLDAINIGRANIGMAQVCMMSARNRCGCGHKNCQRVEISTTQGHDTWDMSAHSLLDNWAN